MPEYVPPADGLSAFNCPHCNAFAHQGFYTLLIIDSGARQAIFDGDDGLKASICANCTRPAVWLRGRIVFPPVMQAPLPNADLPDDIRCDYDEARLIVSQSSRGAAALLRLAIQKLCKHLGEPGDNINNDIKALVAKGLSAQVQKALDTVRVIGNEAVHPGTIDLRDDPNTANMLFKLVNFIAEKMITEPKEIDALYHTLPQDKLDGIAKRDA
jgi:hypothetical protein